MDNLSNYTARTEATRGTGTPTTSFGALRLCVANINTSTRKEREDMEKQIAEFSKKYNKETIQKESQALNGVYKDWVKTKKEMVSDIVDKLELNLTKAIEKLTMIPPRQEKMEKIKSLDERFDSLSEIEFLMHIKDSADNYQEQAYLQSIARKHGKDYDLLFTPEKANEYKEKLFNAIRKEIIPNIGDDPMNHIEMETFLRGTPYGQINPLAEYFESLPIAIEDEEPIPELTNKEKLISDLTEARNICWTNGAKALWEETITVGRDIQTNGLSTDNINKANKLVKIVSEMFIDE